MAEKTITDLAGFAKLAETIGRGIGWIMEPHQIRRLAAATADAEILREQGHQESLTLAQRAAHLRTIQSLREQRNLEAIIVEAAVSLPGRGPISNNPVETDWVAEFFDHARLVGNERIQPLWARLLAGEVANPGAFSRRTLGVLRELSQAEAELFAWFAGIVWIVDGQALGVRLPGDLNRVRADVIRQLQDAGLLLFGPLQGLYQVTLPGQIEFQLRHGNTNYVAKYKLTRSQVDLIAPRLSNAGRELLSVCQSAIDQTLLDACIRHFDEIGLDLRPHT